MSKNMDVVFSTTYKGSPNCEFLGTSQSVYIAHCNISQNWQHLTGNVPTSLVNISVVLSTLRIFPAELSKLPLLTSLDLHGNELQHVGNFSGTFDNLTFLDLSYNNIDYIEAGFFKIFHEVTILDLSHNKLRTVDVELYDLMRCSKGIKVPIKKPINLSYKRITRSTYKKSINLSYNRITKSTYTHWYSNETCVQLIEYGVTFLNLTNNNISLMADILFPWWYHYNRGRVTRNDIYLREIIPVISWEGNPLMLDCVDCAFYSASKEGILVLNELNTSLIEEKYMRYNQRFLTDPLEFMVCYMNTIDCPKNCTCSFYGCQFMFEVWCKYLSTLPAQLTQTFLHQYSEGHAFILSNKLFLRKSAIDSISAKAYLSNTQTLQLTDGVLENIDADAFQSLSLSCQQLDLANNNLKTLPEVTSWPHLQHLTLRNNPWHCDCNIQWMKFWILNFATQSEQKAIICASPFYNAGHQLSSLATYRFFCLSTITSITVSLLLLLCLIIASVVVYKRRFWLYQKYGFHPFDKDECDNEDKKFDVFVSYSNDDYEWARELMVELENLDFRVCCHEGDFLAGTTISENVARAVHFSKRTLCIVSRAFMASSICMHEFITARSFDFSYKKARLLVIMYEDITTNDLHEDVRMYVKSFTYLKRDCPFFMKRLLYRLPQTKLGNNENTPLLLDTHV